MDCSRQAPLSMGFSRQEYWSVLPFPSPGDFPNPGIKSRSPALQADSLPVGLGPWVWEECIGFLYTNASLPSLWTYGWGPQCSSPVQPQGRGDRGVNQAPPPPQTEVSSSSPLGGATEPPPPPPGAKRDPPTQPGCSRSRALPRGWGPAPRRRGLSHDESGAARDPRALGVELAGARGVALTPPQTFPARLGAKGEGSSPGVGRWNPGSRAGRAQAGSRPACDLAEEQWIFLREGAPPCPPPQSQGSPCVGYLQGLAPRAAPDLAARSAPRPDQRADPGRAPDSPDAGGWTDRRAGARGEAAGLF